MVRDIAFALWFFLPAGLANVAPILAAAAPGLQSWNTPIDGGGTYRGRPVLGAHKTWRGLVSGVVLATLTVFLQQLAAGHFGWAAWIASGYDYSQSHTFLLGPLFALGALGGDAAESFFKRRTGIESGRSWLGFDQLDYVIGAIIFTVPVARLTLPQYAWVVVTWFGLHLLFSYIGYLVGLKKEPI
ncbi:MAG: CDP-2,3-bis-(O-geranylgeranyl)-sn-glycerol synthase [Candidatus Saccharimonadales bacterium]